jgi:hypothetical protein
LGDGRVQKAKQHHPSIAIVINLSPLRLASSLFLSFAVCACTLAKKNSD